ncbi:hypothetical protein [Rathayibacter festucae]|nr:hypothetical protein [Rathayibacter festucae]
MSRRSRRLAHGSTGRAVLAWAIGMVAFIAIVWVVLSVIANVAA